MDRSSVDQLVINTRQLVGLHHNAHAALDDVQCTKVAVQRIRPLQTNMATVDVKGLTI